MLLSFPLLGFRRSCASRYAYGQSMSIRSCRGFAGTAQTTFFAGWLVPSCPRSLPATWPPLRSRRRVDASVRPVDRKAVAVRPLSSAGRVGTNSVVKMCCDTTDTPILDPAMSLSHEYLTIGALHLAVAEVLPGHKVWLLSLSLSLFLCSQRCGRPV